MDPQPSGGFDIRPTDEADLRKASDLIRVALLSPPTTDKDWDKYGESWTPEQMDSLCAWEGDRMVGHAGGYRFDTLVPGGARLATSGLTRVGVLPTDTRRGVPSQLMRTLLERVRHDGRPLASLRASEGVIYRRFGFGVSGHGMTIDVDTRRARPIANPASGSFRSIARDEFHDVVPAIYDKAATRPGVITRAPWVWRRYLEDFLSREAAEHVVVHTGADGVDDGFAHYSVKATDGPGTDMTGKGEIYDLWGTSPEVELALWSFLVELDLVRSFHVDERPLDDMITVGAADPRAVATVARYDEQWVRLLDVNQCLAARGYGADTSVVIGVTDPLFADNNGSWRLDGEGAVRTDETPQLRTDVTGVSTVYMGSTPWWQLAAVGLAEADDPHVVERADALFAHRPLAFCGSHF